MKIDHLGVAVRSIEQALGVWRDTLGLELAGSEEVPSEQVRVAFLPLGESRVELLEPSSADSVVGRFLERHGEGLHHVCIAVSDLDAVLARLAERGLKILGDGARVGAGGSRVAFVHPRSTSGVLLELKESK